MTRTYEINPRPPALGGGWSLRLLEDGEEAGGGYFPPVPTDDEAYSDAIGEGEEWAYGSGRLGD